ncbi:phage holin family protein [Tundrisphaera lichenicola]|uniref:phage holin family protein n=1 Tax=Tundrisphaera lichenicola TaxID=2029860 RepID=UPI003EBD4C55
MADQASMSRVNGVPVEASPGSLVGNIAEFGNDVATLAELQAKLTALDAKQCVSRATIPLIVVVTSAVLVLGSIPVFLIGLADLIASGTKLSPEMARLIVGLATILLAALAAVFALRLSLRSLESFRRSNEELARNLSWIRTVLVHSGRSIARPRS